MASYKKHPVSAPNAHPESLIPKGSNFSQKDLVAMSKMVQGENGYNTSAVVMCDVCGQPIAGSEKSKPEEFAREMSAGRHFVCHMEQVAARDENAKAYARMAAPKWADDTLSEDERARLYNADDSDITTVKAETDNEVAATPKVYVPPAGSLPLKKVLDEGGLSAKDPKTIPATEYSDEKIKKELEEFERAKRQADEELAKLYANGDPGLKSSEE